jgi:hypothetical protein
MLSNNACQVRFVRHSQSVDMFRSYELFINRVRIGSIARGASLEVEVPSGSLTIEGRIDWARSRPLTIEAAPNQKIEIEVSNHWGAMLGLWAITFGFRSYLELKQT